MEKKPIDLKNSTRELKPATLMGAINGTPVVVDSHDGKVTRVRPYYYGEDRDINELNPWKIEAGGVEFGPPEHSLPSSLLATYKKRVYSNNRVRYPLKRVDWDPKGERNPQNRGKSKYVRISWDEAVDIIADELLRVRDKYGMTGVLSQADMHGESKHLAPSHGCNNRLLGMLGGYTIQMRNNDSWEGYSWGSKNVWGCEPVGEMQPSGNLYPDIAKNSELLLFWGCDPETTPLGIDGHMASRLCYYLTELGKKCVYVDPALNYGAAVHADKWIPVMPNTDAALYLAVIYVWLTEGTYDREYVQTHVHGYEQFFDYVLGRVDGEPKTPEWANRKCGVPVWTIKALARDWARKITSIIVGNGGPGLRGPYSTEPARLQAICLSMQGLGKPGRHQAKMIEWNLDTPVFPLPYQGKEVPSFINRAEPIRKPNRLERTGHDYSPSVMKIPELIAALDWAAPPAQSIPKCMIHDALNNGHIEWWGLASFIGPYEEQWEKHEYPAPGCSRVHMIWSDSPCMTTCWNDSYRFVEAVKNPEIECFIVQHPWLENDCYLADIILPVCTMYELSDITSDTNSGAYTAVYKYHPSCPPVGESVSDQEVVAKIAKKVCEKFGDMTIYNRVTGNDISDDDLIELFWKGSGVAHLDEKDDFHKKGMFVIPCDPDIQNVPPGLYTFAEDPATNPLNTPTGKLEFTSTGIAENFPDDEERPPYPKWVEKGISHDESCSSERAKKYPLLCMSNHPRWRMHAQCDDITWTREIETMKIRGKDGYQYEPIWLHSSEAEKRGIKHGDILKIFNERGTVLGAAYITERILPGIAYMDHGARFDPIDELKLDRGGAINLITPHSNISAKATGMATSGFLVEVAKVTDEEYAAWKKQYPEAFSRKIDEACGVCLDGWLMNA